MSEGNRVSPLEEMKLLDAAGHRFVEDRQVQESALTSHQWAYLCGYLQMDLQQVLKLTNRELLRAVDAETARRGKRGLLERILRPKSRD